MAGFSRVRPRPSVRPDPRHDHHLPPARRSGHAVRIGFLLPGPVGDKALEMADRHGAPFTPRMHSISHWVSCGQTRPVTAGSALSPRRLSAAAAKLPSATKRMKRGMSTMTGQPAMHLDSLHWMQRWASSMASCSVKTEVHLAEIPAAIGRILLGHRLALDGQALFHGKLWDMENLANRNQFHAQRGRRLIGSARPGRFRRGGTGIVVRRCDTSQVGPTRDRSRPGARRTPVRRRRRISSGRRR